MGLEFVYQTKYESTIDTLALRDNVKKILQNAAIKNTAASDTYQSSSVGTTLNNTDINVQLNKELTSTINFLKSEAALKLLNLTKRTTSEKDNDFSLAIFLNVSNLTRFNPLINNPPTIEVLAVFFLMLVLFSIKLLFKVLVKI